MVSCCMTLILLSALTSVALPFTLVRIGVPDEALGWFPLGFVEDKLFELSHTKK